MSTKYHRDLRRIVKEFLAERGDDQSFTRDELARWALTTGRVKRERGYAERLVIQKLGLEFAEAMREDYTSDPQGRTVREMLAARIGGKTRWNSRNSASRGFLETSFIQRREQVVGDCRHLKNEVDSFNENRGADNPIQMTFDFTNDLAELEAGEAARRQAKKAS